MRELKIFIIGCALVLVLTINVSSIYYQAIEVKKIDTQFHKGLETSQPEGISGIQEPSQKTSDQFSEQEHRTANGLANPNYFQSSNFPITMSNYILFEKIDRNFTSDTVGVLILAANNGGKSLDNFEIYETVPEEYHLLNCSRPVKAASIEEILRMQRKEDALLCAEDITSPKKLIDRLNSNDSVCTLLKSKFSSGSARFLNNSISQDDFITRQLLSKEFNNIIINEKLFKDIKINENFRSEQTNRLLRLSNSTTFTKNDQVLLNLFMLRDLFPCYIRKPDGYLEVIENLNVDPSNGIIHISVPRLLPKECLMFIFYGNITKQGSHKTMTIIRIPDKNFSDFYSPLVVAFPSPEFSVKADLSELDIKPGENIILKYIIDLMSPSNISSNYLFDAKIINLNKKIRLNKTRLNLSYAEGRTSFEAAVSANFSDPGSFNIPTIEINDKNYFTFDDYIRVEEVWHKYISELSLIFLALCTVVASNLKCFRKSRTIRKLFALFAFLTLIFLCILLEISTQDTMTILFLYSFIILYYLIDLSDKSPKTAENENPPAEGEGNADC